MESVEEGSVWEGACGRVWVCTGSLELNLLEVRLPSPSDSDDIDSSSFSALLPRTDETEDAGGTGALALVARVLFVPVFLLTFGISGKLD